MSGLLSEHLRTLKAGGPRFRNRLRSLGVSDEAMWRSMIGAANVQTHKDGSYIPDPNGTPMAVLPICEHYDPPIPADLIAFTFREPWKWWTRTGMAPFVNAGAVTNAWWQERPLLVNATPLDWLRTELEGVVVLDWSPGTVALHLGNDRRMVSPSPEVVTRLTEIFNHDVEPPDIRVAEIRYAA